MTSHNLNNLHLLGRAQFPELLKISVPCITYKWQIQRRSFKSSRDAELCHSNIVRKNTQLLLWNELTLQLKPLETKLDFLMLFLFELVQLPQCWQHIHGLKRNTILGITKIPQRPNKGLLLLSPSCVLRKLIIFESLEQENWNISSFQLRTLMLQLTVHWNLMPSI